MKKFEDLIFKPHKLSKLPELSDMVQALLTFDNKYTISVIGGGGSYGDGIEDFEVAIFTPWGNMWRRKEDTSPVKGYCTKKEVTKIMKNIQNLPKYE